MEIMFEKSRPVQLSDQTDDQGLRVSKTIDLYQVVVNDNNVVTENGELSNRMKAF